MMIDGLYSKKIVRGTITIISCSILFAVVGNYLSPAGLPYFPDPDKDYFTSDTHDKSQGADLKIILTAEAKAIFNQRSAVFVDARSTKNYDEAHIQGAESLSVRDFDRGIDNFIMKFPENSLFIIYCSGIDCSDSHLLASFLSEAGFSDISVYTEGFNGWLEAGYPIEP